MALLGIAVLAGTPLVAGAQGSGGKGPAPAVSGSPVPEGTKPSTSPGTTPAPPAEATPTETKPSRPSEAAPTGTKPSRPSEAAPTGTKPSRPSEAAPGRPAAKEPVLQVDRRHRVRDGVVEESERKVERFASGSGEVRARESERKSRRDHREGTTWARERKSVTFQDGVVSGLRSQREEHETFTSRDTRYDRKAQRTVYAVPGRDQVSEEEVASERFESPTTSYASDRRTVRYAEARPGNVSEEATRTEHYAVRGKAAHGRARGVASDAPTLPRLGKEIRDLKSTRVTVLFRTKRADGAFGEVRVTEERQTLDGRLHSTKKTFPLLHAPDANPRR